METYERYLNMNAKKLTAGCLAAFVTAGSILGIISPAYADTAYDQRSTINKNVFVNANALTDDGLHIESSPTASAGSQNPLPAENTDDSSIPDMTADFYPVDTIGPVSDTANRIRSLTSYSLSQSEWADSGSDYYFSLLSTQEKKLYLNLKKQADIYMTGTDQFQTTKVRRGQQTTTVYILPIVPYTGLTLQQMKKVFYCFMFENPQYYFMRNSVIYSESTKVMTVGLYEIFADGSTRAAYTEQLAQQLDIWEQQIDVLQTTVEKERLIHQIVCSHVDYDTDMQTDDPDDRQMSQSCISAILFNQSTVCAGYAQMFSLLCNRAGIECVTVTSAGHAWNKVRMGSIWYNVDCTWNDSRGDDAYLNVTDMQLAAADTSQKEHVASSEWQGIAPPCTTVFDPDMANAPDTGSNILAPEQLTAVNVQSKTKNKLSISFEPLEGCDGYTVQYAANSSMRPFSQKSLAKTSCAVTGLKSGKSYYVRVRAYTLDSNGEKLYGIFSKKIKAAVR